MDHPADYSADQSADQYADQAADAPVPATPSAKLMLPPAPATETGSVKAWREAVTMDTYLPAAPDRNPLFLEKRVYQGSSGRVYPLPCIDRIASIPVAKQWDAIHIENEFVRVMILPEIGGRIHVAVDKRNGYDFVYRQDVIKPALVGLAGPWVSGGIEFNWPQHHRPATFMPVAVAIEREQGGAITVWCSDHDPMQRMKGMHGVRLEPGRAVLELRVRLYNRTQSMQTFLWWANLAARVHQRYQSFFPSDVRFVADHAKRAVTTFPLSDRPYYGVDYPARAASGVPADEQPSSFVPDGSYPGNDLSWYANIPVPTSYMVTATTHDFFGGYDHAADAGFVHIANHHIAPGKKQWTWGNHAFGYAWDRSLSDDGGPYIELMAGVYTDNQPDFSYLAPGETKTFSQFWYPLDKAGVPQAASLDAALHVHPLGTDLELRIAVTRHIDAASLRVSVAGRQVFAVDGLVLDPRHIHTQRIAGVDNPDTVPGTVVVELWDADIEILRYAPTQAPMQPEPQPATEPEAPSAMATVATIEELYLTGLHLELYRHATRSPEAYWLEALRRDPDDSRTNTAMGRWRLQHGELECAVAHFRRAIDRLTARHPNPVDGEPFYYLGLTLRLLGQPEAAYAAFYKATWVAAWRAPGYHALAELDCGNLRWPGAKDHLVRALQSEAENNNAVSLLVVVLRQLGQPLEAERLLAEALERDPLDHWFRYLAAGTLPSAPQEAIDLALDMVRSGLYSDAEVVFSSVPNDAKDGSRAIALYLRAWMHEMQDRTGKPQAAAELGNLAAAADAAYVFPSRIEEMLALEAARRRNPHDARAPYYLGNYLYDRRRHTEAIAAWEQATQLDPPFPTAWRNLGIGRYNILHDAERARDAYERAFACDPSDARVLYERDQLWKRIGIAPQQRLAELERYSSLVDLRDDLSVERAALLNQAGRPADALELLLSRQFQPWEGGEGLVLGQFVRSQLLLGRQSLEADHPALAVKRFEAALHPPHNLSEDWHLLANRSQVLFWLGTALAAAGQAEPSRDAFVLAACQRGDFQQMSVQPVSEMTYWSALALRALGEYHAADKLLQAGYDYATAMAQKPAEVDYFATSLPTMLLFDEDLDAKRQMQARFLQAQALLGLGRVPEAQALLAEVVRRDPNHTDAAEFLSQLEPNGNLC